MTSVAEPALRCKLEAAGYRKQEVVGVIRQLSDLQAEEVLKKRPTGSCILRIDENALLSGKSQLIISFKYLNKVFHKSLKYQVRVRQKGDFIHCKVDAKAFKFLQTTFFGFLDTVTVFINEFCANKNYLERELKDVDIERELTYRRFVICPDYGHVTLVSKAEDLKHGNKSISVSIDFNEGQFLVIKNSGDVIPTVSTFNDILLDFLNIRSVDTFLVLRALGYNPKALMENVTRDRSYSFAQTRELPRFDASTAAMMSSKDKAALVSMIEESLQAIHDTREMKELPDAILDGVSTIRSAVQLLDLNHVDKSWEAKMASAEKTQWIKHGVFACLVAVVCKLESITIGAEIVTLAIQAIRFLVHGFPLACEAFYQTLWAHLQIAPGPETSISISYLLSELISTRPFSQIFVAESGVWRLIELWNSIINLQRRPVSSIGKVSSSRALLRQNSLMMRPKQIKPPKFDNEHDKTSDTEKHSSGAMKMIKNIGRGIGLGRSRDHPKNESPETTNEPELISPREPSEENASPSKSNGKVPLLNFSAVRDSTKPSSQATPNRAKRRASVGAESRKSDADSDLPKFRKSLNGILVEQSLDETSFVHDRPPSEELKSLATKLGETYMAADLTVLLGFKEYADARAQRRLLRKDVSVNEDESNAAAFTTLRASAAYKIKCNILKTLRVLLEDSHFKPYARSPINLLFSELSVCYKDPIMRDDEPYRQLIFGVLQHAADAAEELYSNDWSQNTSDLSAAQVERYRKKSDLMLWRVFNRILGSMEAKNFDDLELYMRILADYARNCSSRVMPNQIIDVCMETLLQIKAFIIKKRVDAINWKTIAIVHQLLRIFDEVATRNRFLPLNDLLITMFLQKEETYDFFKNYSGIILSSAELEKKVVDQDSVNGPATIREWRTQVIRHYKTCVSMIRKQYKTDYAWNELLSRDSTKLRLLKKFEFLVLPSGIVQRMLNEGSQYHNFGLKKEILEFFHKILSIKHCQFTRNKLYIDSYISFHYNIFIKLYNNYALDKQTLELCRRHLKILIDFAIQKNEEIRLKFYQLRCMDFLGREVNLEFEVKVKRKRIAQDAQRREQDKKRAQEAIKEIREKLNLIPLDQQRSEGAGQFLAPPSNSASSSPSIGPSPLSSPQVHHAKSRSRSFTVGETPRINSAPTMEVPKLNLGSLVLAREGSVFQRMFLPSTFEKSLSMLDLSTPHRAGSTAPLFSSRDDIAANTRSASVQEGRNRARSVDYGELMKSARSIQPRVRKTTSKTSMSANTDRPERPSSGPNTPKQSPSSSPKRGNSPAPSETRPRKRSSVSIIHGSIPTSEAEAFAADVAHTEHGGHVRMRSSGPTVSSSRSPSPGKRRSSSPELMLPIEPAAATSESPNLSSSSKPTPESPAKPKIPSLSLTPLGLAKGTILKPELSAAESAPADAAIIALPLNSAPAPVPAAVKTPATPASVAKAQVAAVGSPKKRSATPPKLAPINESSESDTSPRPPGSVPNGRPKVPSLKIGLPGKSPVPTLSLGGAKAADAPTDGSKTSPIPKLKLGGVERKEAKKDGVPASNLPVIPDVPADVDWDKLESEMGDDPTGRRPGDRRMTLTSMENQMRGSAKLLKLQVVLDRQKESAAKAEDKDVPDTPDILKLEERLYQDERDNRKLYADEKLHLGFLELIFFLLIAPNGFTLDSLYTAQFPMNNLKMNVPFILWSHCSHPANTKTLGALSKRTQKVNESAFRLLKLLSTRFFRPSLYQSSVRISEGAYGTVYAAKLLGEDVAVKLMSVPKNIQDRCVLHDIFTEILVLDKWKADERICKLIDYGVDDEHYWITMKRYKTSLKTWRHKQKKPFMENLPLLLNVFTDVLNCVRFLSENRINHYDIKCDNFLINPIDPNMTDEDLYNPSGDTPPFTVCLADFGESIVYTTEEESYTTDNRGTEFIKSPEMLTIAYASNKERQTFDRRKKVGASKASDIWSIGCLLYEILTGEFLFYDDDWVRFWFRVTTQNEQILSEKKKEAIHHNQHIMNFLQWVLIRDPMYRPTYTDLIQRFSIVKQQILDELRRPISARAAESSSESGGSTSRRSSGAESDILSPKSGSVSARGEEELEMSVVSEGKMSASPSPSRSRHRRQVQSMQLQYKRGKSKSGERPSSPDISRDKSPRRIASPVTATPAGPAQSSPEAPVPQTPTAAGSGSTSPVATVSVTPPPEADPSPSPPDVAPDSLSPPQPAPSTQTPRIVPEPAVALTELPRSASPSRRAPPIVPALQLRSVSPDPRKRQPLSSNTLTPHGALSERGSARVPGSPKKSPRTSSTGNSAGVEPATPHSTDGDQSTPPDTPPTPTTPHSPGSNDPGSPHMIRVPRSKVKRVKSVSAAPSKVKSRHQKSMSTANVSALNLSSTAPIRKGVPPLALGFGSKVADATGPTSTDSTSNEKKPSAPIDSNKSDSGSKNKGRRKSVDKNSKKVIAPNNAEARKSADSFNVSILQFEASEKEYFAANPSQITNTLLLGSHECTHDKEKLKTKWGITHIINCTNKNNMHPFHFKYEQLVITDPDAPITTYVSKIFIFVREAVKQKGKILIVDSEGSSIGVALTVAILMKLSNTKLSFYEAYHHVALRRYTVQLLPQHIQQLSEWVYTRAVELKKDFKQVYRCICGANTYNLLSPFDTSASQNPFPCRCDWDTGSSCPNVGCADFLYEMSLAHKWDQDFVKWGYSTVENIKGHFDEVDEFNPIDLLTMEQRNHVDDKEWRLFKCRKCNYITHAMSTADANVIAIVVNIPVETAPTDKK